MPRQLPRLCRLQATRSARDFCAALLLSVVAFQAVSSAQEQQPAPPPSIHAQLGHRPLEIAKLPLPGSLMPITVELTNSRDIETKIRLVGSRDGRFMDIAFPIGTLNKADRAEFILSVPAPLASMTYQFIVHQPDGNLTTSARYLVRRPCIQNFRVEVAKDDPNAEVKQKLGALIAKSKVLERDTQNLETSLKLLEDLSESLKQ